MLTTTPVEPQRARFTKNNIIIKDHYYYNGNEFKWNKPSQTTDKYYPYYHQQQQEHKERIEGLKAMEGYDSLAVEQARREILMQMKKKTKTMYDDRVKERLLIQNKSQQVKSLQNLDTKNIESDTFDVIAKRLVASKHLRSDDISWNHMHKASKKFVDQFITPVSLRGEDTMIQYFKKKLEEEKAKAHNELEQRAINHKVTRNIFLAKHEENYEKELKIKYPTRPQIEDPSKASKSSAIPSIQVLDCDSPRNSSKNTLPNIAYPSLSSMDGEFRLKYLSSVPNLDKKNTSYNSLNLDKLAEPRKSPQKDYSLEYSELNGMLIRNMDEKVFYSGNPFFESLANQNEFFQDTLSKNREANQMAKRSTPPGEKSSVLSRTNGNSKPSISSTTKRDISYRLSPVNNYHSNEPKLKTISEREECLDELDTFENKMPLVNKKVGYGNAQLVETFEILNVPRRKDRNF